MGNIIRAIEILYDLRPIVHSCTTTEHDTGSELQPKSHKGDYSLCNIFPATIMFEALDDHDGSVSIGGQIITNFRLADGIVVNTEEGKETEVLVWELDPYTKSWKKVKSHWDAIGDVCICLTKSRFAAGSSGCNCNAWWSPTNDEEVETDVVWPLLKIPWHCENNPAGGRERSKKDRKTKEKLGRQHQRMGRNGAEDRKRWKGIVATSSVVPRWLSMLRDWDEIRSSILNNSSFHRLTSSSTNHNNSSIHKLIDWHLALASITALASIDWYRAVQRLVQRSQRKTWHPCANELHLAYLTAKPDLSDEVQPMLK